MGAYQWGHPFEDTPGKWVHTFGDILLQPHGQWGHPFWDMVVADIILGTSCGADIGDVPSGTCWQWEHPSGNTPALCPSGGRS